MKKRSPSPLNEWLKSNGVMKTFFAKKIGVSPDQLRTATNGGCPSVKVAHAIVAGTEGAVDYNALFDPDGSRRRQSKRR